MQNYVLMTVTISGVYFSVSRAGKEVYSGCEPYSRIYETGDIARAAIRATHSAMTWAEANGGISGMETIGL